MGRRPIPTALKIARGNPGKRPLHDMEPKPEKSTLEPPKGLTGRALDEWNRIAEECVFRGIITVLDEPLLEAWCVTVASFRRAADNIRRYGEIRKTDKGHHTLTIYSKIQSVAIRRRSPPNSAFRRPRGPRL